LYQRTPNQSDKIITIGNTAIGKDFICIAGPCAVESEEQIVTIAEEVKKFGVNILRGGAFKPRTSPYTFRGLGEEGLRLLSIAKKKTGLPVVSEIVSPRLLPLFDDVDILQIGARNMQNFELLTEVGKTHKPVILKRGMGATIKEWLLAGEYILKEGCEKLIFCERGVRNPLVEDSMVIDYKGLSRMKELTPYPLIVDPSHLSKNRGETVRNAYEAIDFGIKGLIIEVHNNPSCALCDGDHAIIPEDLSGLIARGQKLVNR